MAETGLSNSVNACHSTACDHNQLYSQPTNFVCDNYSIHNHTNSSQQLATLTMACSMLCLCIWGLYGNLVCVFIFSHRSMRSSVNVLLTGLSGLDSVILLLSIPSFIVPALDDFRSVPYWGCLYPLVIRFVYPLVMTAQTASVWTFVVISLERDQRRLFCGSFAYNTIRFWEYTVLDEPPWFTSLLRDNEYYFSVYYTGFYLAFNFLLPFAIILILNAKIASNVRHVGSRHKNVILRSTTAQRQSEYRTTRMIFVVTTMFAICNTPAYVVNIWEAFDKQTFTSGHFIAFLLSDAATCLILINSATTLLIYLAFCRRFRRLFCAYHSCGYRSYQSIQRETKEIIQMDTKIARRENSYKETRVSKIRIERPQRISSQEIILFGKYT